MRSFWLCLMVLAACDEEVITPPDAAPDCGCPAAILSVSPLRLEFGTVAVSSTSQASTAQITNTGFSESGSISAIVTGMDAAEFTVQNGCTTLAMNGTCVMSVVFKPTTAGTKAATLVVTGSPGGSAMVTISGVAN